MSMLVAVGTSFLSSSMMEARAGEGFLLVWFNLLPSINMLPLFENSMLLEEKSSAKPPVGMLMSKDMPFDPRKESCV